MCVFFFCFILFSFKKKNKTRDQTKRKNEKKNNLIDKEKGKFKFINSKQTNKNKMHSFISILFGVVRKVTVVVVI